MSDTAHVILTRGYKSDKVTLGMLQIEGIPHDPIFTLENPWKNNVKKHSCIPDGSYPVKPYSGTRYKNVWLVSGVPDRSAILIHYGNTEEDTDGCVLLGMSAGRMKTQPAILESVRAIQYLRSLLGQKEFILTIK